MSEHIAAEIWIGGKIPQSLVLRLCEAIRREGVSLEWGDAFFQPYTAEDLLAVRRADAKWEYDGELVMFRQDVGVISTPTNAAGEPVVTASQLASLAPRLQKAMKHLRQGRGKDAVKALSAATRALREFLPPHVSPLEPFEITPGNEPESEHG